MAELRYQGDKKCSLQAKWPLYGTGTFFYEVQIHMGILNMNLILQIPTELSSLN